MSKGVNKAIIVGNIGKTPESRSFQNGGSVCNFSVATSEEWKDKQTGEKKSKTEWHNCVASNRLGEIVQQYAGKGQQVYVEGSLQTRKWQDQSGQDKYTTEIKVLNFQLLGARSEGGSKPAPRQEQQSNIVYDDSPPY